MSDDSAFRSALTLAQSLSPHDRSRLVRALSESEPAEESAQLPLAFAEDPANEPTSPPSASRGVSTQPPTQETSSEEPDDIPFYRKVIAQARGEDTDGFGPNWSNVDDFDIPTVLRKQMD